MDSNSVESSLVIAGDDVPLKLFVYGALLRGYCNHFIVEPCRLIGDAKTVDKYTLFVDDYPYVNTLVENKAQIVGELYEVTNSEVLHDLDMLEGHPDFYVRSPCRVKLTDSEEIVDAQIYFNNRASTDVELVASGDYRLSTLSQIRLKSHFSH